MSLLINISGISYVAYTDIKFHLLRMEFSCDNQFVTTKEITATSLIKFDDNLMLPVEILPSTIHCTVYLDSDVYGEGSTLCSGEDVAFKISIFEQNRNSRIALTKCSISVEQNKNYAQPEESSSVNSQPRPSTPIELQSTILNVHLPSEVVSSSVSPVSVESNIKQEIPSIESTESTSQNVINTQSVPESTQTQDNQTSTYAVEEHSASSVKDRINLFSKPVFEINKKEKPSIEDHDNTYKPVSNSIFLSYNEKYLEEQKQKEEQQRLLLEKQQKEEFERQQEIERQQEFEQQQEPEKQQQVQDSITISVPNDKSVNTVEEPLLVTTPKTYITSACYAIWIVCFILFLLFAIFLIYWLFYL